MDAHAGTHASQNPLTEDLTVDNEHEPGKMALNGHLVVSNNPSPSPSNVRLSILTEDSDIGSHDGQLSSVHPPKAIQEPSDIQMARNKIDHDDSCMHSESDPDSVVLTAFREVSFSECAFIPLGGSSSLTSLNDSETHTLVCPQELPLLRARTVSLESAPHEAKEAGSLDCLNYIQVSHTKLDHAHGIDVAPLTNEEEAREDFNYPCEDLPSSLPPESSPPRLFLSSPCASSQSSIGGIETSKMVLAVEADGCASLQDCSRDDYMVPVVQDESCLGPENLHDRDIINLGTSPETTSHCLWMDPTSCIEGGSQPSRKRATYEDDPDESHGPHLIKRPKHDTDLHLPPTPKRATLASQNRQFKKLTAPFRPPFRSPVVTDGLVPITNNKETGSTISIMTETDHDKINTKASSVHLFPPQYRASNTSRSVTQFKSPLINRVLPADSRTIRLTPAVQAFERKVQVLKRAIKVKEDKEEEILTRLAGKWIEAGKEVAYEVWDATKDAGDPAGKVASTRGSYCWESNNNGDIPWGWDSKPADVGGESCDLDPSMAACDAGRLVHEDEENDVGRDNLGTMLRQLGIAPEIFGWDDEKETFSN